MPVAKVAVQDVESYDIKFKSNKVYAGHGPEDDDRLLDCLIGGLIDKDTLDYISSLII